MACSKQILGIIVLVTVFLFSLNQAVIFNDCPQKIFDNSWSFKVCAQYNKTKKYWGSVGINKIFLEIGELGKPPLPQNTFTLDLDFKQEITMKLVACKS